jgi:hypothetical protein
MANPTTNYGFVLPTSSDLVTDLPADFDVALQGVDTRLKALQPGTTLGDLAYSSATANTNTRLGIGSTGNVLTVAGGVPTWAAPTTPSFIGCSLTNSAGITLTTATDTKLTWNTENYDTSGFHAGSSTAVIIPAGLAGKYLITGTLCFDANTGGQRYIFTRVNGTLVASNQDSAGVAAGVPKAWCFTNVVNLAVNDSIEFHAFQNSGGNLNVLFTGGYVTNVQVTYLGA